MHAIHNILIESEENIITPFLKLKKIDRMVIRMMKSADIQVSSQYKVTRDFSLS